VVLQELYAGARSNADKRDLDAIHRAFSSRGYVVTPEHLDWVDAGIILARYQRGHGEVEPRHHINDILIVLGAAKLDADLVTENAGDMERWRRMLRGRMKKSRILGVKRRDHRNLG
jgi:predicted nucleic acid-binding protein